MWGDPPPNKKTFLLRSLGPKSARVRWGKKPPRGQTRQSATPPKIWTQFSRKKSVNFFLNFRHQRCPQLLWFPHDRFHPQPRERYHRKKLKNFTLGAWPQNSTPDPHVPRNLSRAHREAHDPEKISEIEQWLAEKIEFEKKIWRPWRPNRKRSWSPDRMCEKLSLGTRISENIKTLGLELTTLSEFFRYRVRPH